MTPWHKYTAFQERNIYQTKNPSGYEEKVLTLVQ